MKAFSPSLPMLALFLLIGVFKSYAWIAPSIQPRPRMGQTTVATTYHGSLILWSSSEEDDGWGDEERNTPEELAPLKASSAKVAKQEPDLFIPIFAIVSLLGLFGSYAYEMIRLASRGELYLPWN